MFQVVLAVLPSAVNNCTLYNRTDLSVEIQCIPGYDGGLPQIFVLEMFSTKTGSTRFNITNPDEPQFILDNLDTLTTMMSTENNSLKVRIYAVNQKGRSPFHALHDLVIGYTLLKTENDASMTLSPFFVGTVLTIIVISLVIALRIFITTFLQNLKRNRQKNSKAPVCGTLQQAVKIDSFKIGNLEKPRWQHTDIKGKSSSDDIIEDERDPDVIPSQFAGCGEGADSNNGSEHHHFTPKPITKWSPSSNHTIYDTVLQANIINSPGIPTYNQINTRSHLATTTGLSGAGGATSMLIGCSSSNPTVTSPIRSVTSSSTASPTPHVISNVLASTATLGASGGGIGLSTGPNTIRTATKRTVAVPGNLGTNGIGHSITIITPSIGNSRGGVGSAVGCGGTNNTTLSSDSSHNISTNLTTDLEDININAIKDCLMTQRVPESCV